MTRPMLNPRGRQPNARPPAANTQIALAALFVIGFAYVFGSWTMAICLAIAVAFHEYGHVLAFRRTGRNDATFYLLPFLGGVATSRHPHRSDQDAAYVALMGPGYSLALVLICLAINKVALSIGGLQMSLLAYYTAMLMSIAAALNFINLLPFWPLDGGHVFYALARRIAPRYARAALMAASGALAAMAILGGLYILGMFLVLALVQQAGASALHPPRPTLTDQQAIVLALAYAVTLAAHYLAGRVVLGFYLPTPF